MTRSVPRKTELPQRWRKSGPTQGPGATERADGVGDADNTANKQEIAMADATDDPENPSLEEIERQLAEAARVKEAARMYAGAAARMYEDSANARNRAAADRMASARRDINLRLCRLLAVAKEKRDGRHPNLSVLDLLIETLETLTWDEKL